MNENENENEIEIQNEVIIKDNKRPIILAGATLSLIIIIITGIIVYFVTTALTSKIILSILFTLIMLIGCCMIFYIEYQKRQAIERKKQRVQPIPRGESNRGWVRSLSTLEAQYIQPAPSAPKLSVASGWALNPRKWSIATTAPAMNSPPPLINGTVI